MNKLKIALDFDGLMARTSITKTNWISENVPNWKELLEKLQIGEKLKMPKEAVKKIDSIPPWLTDRINCIPVIGKDNYEKMSLEIYGPLTLQTPEIEGVKEGINDLAKRGHELIILTSRRREHLEFVRKWLEEKGMDDLFSEIHSVRETDNKVPFCVGRKVDVLIDDELRFLRGNAPNLLKILVASGSEHFDGLTMTRMLKNGKPTMVPIINAIRAENIVYVPKFHPDVRNVIINVKEDLRN